LKTTGTFFLKKDNLQLGLLLGFALPLLIILLLYTLKAGDEPFADFMQSFGYRKDRITFFGIWCIVANIALFTYYVNTQKDRTAKGVFAVTLVYGIGVLLAKVFI
jgi:hypothetical protein